MKSLKGKKIIVTGGAGFIGSHIADELLRHGAQVVIVDDFSTGHERNIAHLADQVEVVRGSITDFELLKRVFAGAHAVIHQAALPSVPKSIQLPLETHHANSRGTLTVLHAAQQSGVDRVVFASSSSVYGDTEILPKVETMHHKPLSPYAIQKLTGELYGQFFNSLHGLKTIGLRYFNVFGPRQNPHSEYSAVIPKFVALMKKGSIPQIYGDGEHTRDFTYVDNVVQANIRALLAEAGFGKVFNVATGGQISLNQLVSRINKLIGTSITPVYMPARRGDIKDSYADITAAKTTLGFEPHVPFEEGLKRTIAWLDSLS